MNGSRLDRFDRKMLALLQLDGRLSNNELSERINLSPSQCSRRRQRLEEDGFITGYRAVLDRDRLGFSLVNIISVTLSTHNRDNARQFAKMVQWGQTPMQALQAATVRAAELLGRSDQVGSLKPGLYADVVAVPGNPLDNIASMEKVAFVMKGGKIEKPLAR